MIELRGQSVERTVKVRVSRCRPGRRGSTGAAPRSVRQSREAAASGAGLSLAGGPSRCASKGRGAAGCCLLPAGLRPRPPRGQWSTATPPRWPLAGPRARDCRLGDGGPIPVCDEGRRPKDATRTCRRRVVPKRRNRGPRSGRPLSAQPHFRCSLSPPHGPGDKSQSWSWGCGERRQQS